MEFNQAFCFQIISLKSPVYYADMDPQYGAFLFENSGGYLKKACQGCYRGISELSERARWMGFDLAIMKRMVRRRSVIFGARFH